MPSILCFGYSKGDQNVPKDGYQIATVQTVSKVRHRVVALPRSDKPLEEGNSKAVDPVAVEVDGAIDLTTDVVLEEDERFAPILNQMSSKLQQRQSSTIIATGMIGSGKSEVISRLLPAILSAARRHIDTSGREARERREHLRQLEQQKLMQEKKETELRDNERMQVLRLRHQSDISISSSPRSSIASQGTKRDSKVVRNRKSSKPLMDEVEQRMQSLGKRGFIHTPAPPPPPDSSLSKSPHPPSQRKSVVFNSDANEAFNSSSPGSTDESTPTSTRSKVVVTTDAHFRRSSSLKPSTPEGGNSNASPRPRVSISLESSSGDLGTQKGQTRMKSVDFGDILNRKPSIPPAAKKGRTPESGGKGKGSMCVKFEADKESRVLLPEIVGLNQCANEVMVECWVKTTVSDRKMTLLDIGDSAGNCRLAIHLNANTFDELSPGVTRLIIQDSLHKAVEGHILYDHLFDGTWHLLQCHIVNARENKLDIRIDGIAMRMFTNAQSDEPFSFASWVPNSYLGAELCRPSGTSFNFFFEGMISEVRLWDMSQQPRVLMYRAPLTEGTGSAVSEVINYQVDNITDTQVPAKRVGELIGAEWAEAHFPPTALKMSGFHAINVGTLGDFGQTGLPSFCIELWMRTKERQRPMSLLKVTDSQKRHMSFGITLNEPGPEQLLLELTDSKGDSLSCVWTPTTGNEITDGQWHSIQWKVTDSNSNSSYAKIDDTIIDIKFLSRQGPSSFIPFNDYLALGAHNNRGRLEKFFDGMLRHIILSTSESIIAAWELNEGPGARLALDSGDPLADATSDFHHGIYLTVGKVDRRTSLEKPKSPRKFIKHWTEWVKCEVPDSEKLAGAMLHRLDKKELSSWSCNTVKAACVCVRATQKGDSNALRESLFDVLHNNEIVIGENDDLPDTVWSILDDTESLIECFYGTQHQLEEAQSEDRSHNIWLIGIGDSVQAFFDLTGLVLPQSAVFDPLTASWQSAVTNLGKSARSATCLNKATTAVHNCLSKIGSFPQIWKIKGAYHDKHTATVPWDDSLVTRLLKKYSLACPEVWSNLYVFHTTASNQRKVALKSELLYSVTSIERIRNRSVEFAVHKLQTLAKNTKLREDSRRFRNRIRSIDDRRRRSIALRQENPSAAPKKTKLGLIISSWNIGEGATEDANYELADNASRVSEVLAKNGFTIKRMDSLATNPSDRPTKDNILTEITRHMADEDAMLIIYVAARVGSSYSKKPIFGYKLLHLLDSHDAAKNTIIKEEQEARSRICGNTMRKATRTPVPPHQVKPKVTKRYSRVGAGGPGIRTSPRKASDAVESPVKDIALTHANECAHFQLEEATCRSEVDQDECQRFSLILSTAKEVHDRERAASFSTPDVDFLCFDDCLPTAVSTSNTMSLSQLSAFCLPKNPIVGLHRTLIVDTSSWAHIQTSGGESLSVRYTCQGDQLRSGCTMSIVIAEGLWGAAQPKQSPLVLEGERDTIDQHGLVAYLSQTVSKDDGQQITESVLDGELVGDAVICSKIHRSPEDYNRMRAEEDKLNKDSSLSEPTHSTNTFWIRCGINADMDTSSTDFTDAVTSSLGELGEGVVHISNRITLPILDFIIPSSVDATNSATYSFVSHTLETLCEEQRHRDDENHCDGESSIGSAVIEVSVLASVSNRKTVFRVQKKYLNEPTDHRWLLPPSARKELYQDMAQFSSELHRRWCCFCDSFAADAGPQIDVLKYSMTRLKATPLTIQRLLSRVRSGKWTFFNQNCKTKNGSQPDKQSFSLEIGAFTAFEQTEFERRAAVALETNRQLAADRRKKKEAADKQQKMLELNSQAIREQKAHILEKLKGGKLVKSPADLKMIFGLQDPELLQAVSSALLNLTALPYMSPLHPGPDPDQTPRGFRFVKQLVDWGIWDVLSKVFEQGTGHEHGLDDVQTTSDLLKLLLASTVIHRAQFKNDPCFDVVQETVKYHLCTPTIVRWGLLIIIECDPERLIIPQLSLSALEFIITGMSRTGAELAKRVEAIIVCLRGIKHALLGTIDDVLLQRISRCCLYLMMVVWSSITNSVGEKFDRTLLPLVIEMAADAIAAVIDNSGDVARIIFSEGGVPLPPEVSCYSPEMAGPGVVQCSECSARFLHKTNNDGCCEKSTLPTGKHTAVQIDLMESTIDNNTPHLPSDCILITQMVSNMLSILDTDDHSVPTVISLVALLRRGIDPDASYSHHIQEEVTSTNPEVLFPLLVSFSSFSPAIRKTVLSFLSELLPNCKEVSQSFISFLEQNETTWKSLSDGLEDDCDIKNMKTVNLAVQSLVGTSS
eukprot:TRINITY_DN10258_c0_g1_i2.p1 TRINITY_DN10258_c0_g1~~TRINITY_DN10258_c0_g1_i2.p1  ORF type:complete len:2287 (+),score=397.49 TRINITY_DN10258_c0_g1_i2:51-6911(+)